MICLDKSNNILTYCERIEKLLVMNTTNGQSHAAASTGSPAYQAYWILHVGFTVAPILAGFGQVLPPLGQLGPVPAWSSSKRFTHTAAHADAGCRRHRDCSCAW